jgi:4a-hydroxytetrahydrobiopterin dehydratase
MNATANPLAQKHCQSCEGGVPPITPHEAQKLLRDIPGWELLSSGKRIGRRWKVKDFATGIDFFQRVARIADDEDHHPDLHLANYRDVTIELWTHAIGGLSENDFILAAKINELPLQVKGA